MQIKSQWEPQYTLCGKVKWFSHHEKCIKFPQKPKNRTTVWPSNSTPGLYPEENKNID